MSRTGVSRTVLPFRRKRSWKRRVTDAARSAPKRGRELRDAAAQLDLPSARSWLAGVARENFMRFVLNPTMDFYMRRRATGLPSAHNLSIVPIRVTGTAAAMPPGRIWPKRLHGKLLSKRHRIEVSFGEPIRPSEDAAALIERVQSFFENGDGG